MSGKTSRCPRCHGEVEVIEVPSPANPYSVLLQCAATPPCGWTLLVDYQAAHP